MTKNRRIANVKSADSYAAKLQQALDDERRRYIESVRLLPPLEKAEAFLLRVAQHAESYGDHEALVYLASRRKNCNALINTTVDNWRAAVRIAIQDCARGTPMTSFGNRRSRTRYVGGMSLRQARNVKVRSVVELRNFWGFCDSQEFSIDATMLRTVEWCGITGFAGWWDRLAREERESVLHGGVSGVPAVYRLFSLCRSDLAIRLMKGSLIRTLEACEAPEGGQDVPWRIVCPRGRHPKVRYVAIRNFTVAAMLAFARMRLGLELVHHELLHSALVALLRSQDSTGGWHTWEDQRTLDVEATAIAVHALALIKPNGWERAVQRAAIWLWAAQYASGCWSDAGAPDDVYLTVLVLDAIQLATGGQKVTFKFPTSSTGISRTTAGVLFQYDAFISHASEDKDSFVRPLARALSRLGCRIWFDEFELHVGDSLRRSIDKGLAKSAYGIVVLSKTFFSKNWSQYELDGLVAREMGGRKVILPIWHGVNRTQVMKYSPPLADKFAANSKSGLARVVRDLVLVLKQRPVM